MSGGDDRGREVVLLLSAVSLRLVTRAHTHNTHTHNTHTHTHTTTHTRTHARTHTLMPLPTVSLSGADKDSKPKGVP